MASVVDRPVRAAVVPPPTRRGLSRSWAAGYVGVSATKFDKMVSDGRMPKPKRIDGRKVWDVRALDEFFDALPCDGGTENNPWDEH